MIMFSQSALAWHKKLKNIDARSVTTVLEIIFNARSNGDHQQSVYVDPNLLPMDLKQEFSRGLMKLLEVGVLKWSLIDGKTYLIEPCNSDDGSGYAFFGLDPSTTNMAFSRLVTRTLSENTILYLLCINLNTKNNTNTNLQKQSRRTQYDTEIYQICEYLNRKTTSTYRHSSATIQKLVTARLAEGFSVDDFKKVIDTKSSNWKGTDFEKYLRPQTLFGNKFEGYLNEKSPEQSRKVSEQKAHSYLSDIMKGE